jgi:F-type H+-transporting ATPase subunit b
MSALFEAFGVNWQLLIVQAINFGLLLGALTYLLYKPVLRIIDERREKIADGVRTAEAADARLADAKAESEQLVGDAAREAESLVASARSRADEKAKEVLAVADEKARNVLRDAEARAEEAKRRAVAESSKEIARVAMLAAEKLLRERSA